MDEYGKFGIMAGPTAERWRLDTDPSTSAGTMVVRKNANSPLVANPA